MEYQKFEHNSDNGSQFIYTRVEARRCIGGDSKQDEAQIEIMIQSVKRGGIRRSTELGSLVLSPAEARRLALAICPELATADDK
jgi:hypothetical protein